MGDPGTQIPHPWSRRHAVYMKTSKQEVVGGFSLLAFGSQDRRPITFRASQYYPVDQAVLNELHSKSSKSVMCSFSLAQRHVEIFPAQENHNLKLCIYYVLYSCSMNLYRSDPVCIKRV